MLCRSPSLHTFGFLRLGQLTEVCERARSEVEKRLLGAEPDAVRLGGRLRPLARQRHKLAEDLLDRLHNVVDNDFGRVSYTEAVEILQKSGVEFEYPVEWGTDLQSEHERYLTEKVFNKPIFVTNYPKEIKAFYMRENDDGKTVAAADLLVPGVGEIVGGSQREERYDVLKAKCDKLGMDMTEYQWYLDLRRYGGVEHAGFGLGLDRIVMYVTGMTNIRDVGPFPRTAANLEM